ncbi:hypothetical protein ACOMHN_043394 [Nucella lapillus]
MADNGSNSTHATLVSGEQVFANATEFKAARSGISRDESTTVYEAWAASGSYDQDMNDEKYCGAKAAAEALAELYPTDREHVLVLDVACGTGIVAEKLQKVGFKRIHGLDPSSGMLELADQKKVYEKLLCCYLDSSKLTVVKDMYDCAVSSGGMCEGHIPTSGLRQLIPVVKPEGAVCIVMRESFLRDVLEYRGRLEKEMTDMEKEGLWRLASRTSIPNYFYQHTGVVFIFRLPG